MRIRCLALMIRISNYANEILYQTLSSHLGRRKSYGPPPVFYWFRNVISEVNTIDTCSKIGIGEHTYNMANSLGVVYFSCEYINNQRIIFITDFKFNARAIDNWQTLKSKNVGITRPNKQNTSTHSGVKYKLLNKYLFGLRYVTDNRGHYNLLNKEGNLLTQWFTKISPYKEPYGRYKIIAFINIGGWAHALSESGQTYSLDRTWTELYAESLEKLDDIITEAVRNNKRAIRVTTESHLRRIVENAVRKALMEMR